MISFPNKNDHQNKKLLALLLAFVLAATTISGCGRLIPKIGQVTDAPKSGQSGAGTGSAGAGGQSAGTGQSGADGENAGLSAELFTLP